MCTCNARIIFIFILHVIVSKFFKNSGYRQQGKKTKAKLMFTIFAQHSMHDKILSMEFHQTDAQPNCNFRMPILTTSTG